MIHKQNSIKDKKADRNSNKSDIVYKNEKLVETTGPQTNFSEIGSHLEANQFIKHKLAINIKDLDLSNISSHISAEKYQGFGIPGAGAVIGKQAQSDQGSAQQKIEEIYKFSHASRAGDGSDPFSRYKYCFSEYISAISNLLDDKQQNRTDINIHALYACLETYNRNLADMLKILSSMRQTLVESKQMFMSYIKEG